jgi:putative ABC transport system ATP-binding protein
MAIIAINQLTYRWQPAAEPTLIIEHFSVEAGERLFIKGASGSGKSTLLSLIGGVLTAERGEIALLGQPLSTLSTTQRDRLRADHIGFIFQMFNLIPYLSVLENVLLPLHFSPRRRQRTLAQGRVEDEALRLLGHLGLSGELLARDVTRLSVGQQQRVAAARALIGCPEIVIADEPTSALDSDLRRAFITLLIDECRAAGSTLLFVSHDGALESSFDRSVALTTINRAPVMGEG